MSAVVKSVEFAISAGEAVLVLGIGAFGLAGMLGLARAVWRRR